ncbi:uncharacterized protein N7483_010490 [Penicillium malachiteum]|uniref:uncharacterized protein n=1 Tax=Penicillium malachiteum TaxID=1324776 RepID=UPI002548AD4A|nr:uncharacterized protein N7483_010490 [Penicillium malachiteum]KAJ5713309.1 hypothetical protein N7483_010490 [Penicillium malachiteum]
MTTPTLGYFVDIESSSHVASPPPAVQKAPVKTPSMSIELNELQPAQNLEQVTDAPMAQVSVGSQPPTPGGLDSLIATPANENESIQWAPDRTLTPQKTKWRLLSSCLMLFGNGMNDSAPGALIPYMEEHYGISYTIVSMIFVGNALGFILAAPVTHYIDQKLGRARSYTFSMFTLAVAYIIIACQPPFPVVAVSFFLLGFGVALQLTLNNTYCANLPNSTTALGLVCGAYGIGGTVAPLFATAMASSGIRWSLFYTIPVAAAVFNLFFATWAFSNFEQDTAAELQRTLRPTDENVNIEEPLTRSQLLRRAIQNRTTLLGALFIFAYQGAEVSISGWVVSFLINYRNGDPSRVGYVSSGFWAGITTGRFLLVHPAAKLGEKVSVMGMIAGAVIFQLMTWLIPNVIGEAVTVAILGVLLGAVYPCAASVLTRLLPRNMHISSLSFVSALGSSGGAVWPFLTGILSQHVGTMVLHPICIGLYGVMATSWLLLPKISKRSE